MKNYEHLKYTVYLVFKKCDIKKVAIFQMDMVVKIMRNKVLYNTVQ